MVNLIRSTQLLPWYRMKEAILIWDDITLLQQAKANCWYCTKAKHEEQTEMHNHSSLRSPHLLRSWFNERQSLINIHTHSSLRSPHLLRSSFVLLNEEAIIYTYVHSSLRSPHLLRSSFTNQHSLIATQPSPASLFIRSIALLVHWCVNEERWVKNDQSLRSFSR